ncbi:MAG: 2-dehydro-3-deoxy-6-phosphogalactonate aldolase [Rubrivivax sp.]|jgi:2-dehydro-3-deoxyphosphogalactonate aldolase|nr:2-dehydro-3-deoxy-6-phosphogalactonate aldolase [Rubrivivax sp.]
MNTRSASSPQERTQRPAALPHLDPPLVAILRGLPAEDAASVGAALFEAGFRAVEVPLNRPGALQAIATLTAMAPAGTLIGAGTVMSPQDVQAVAEAGGRLIVCPHCDPAVIDEAVALGLWCVPGVGTASEAFTALRHGAHGLKLFPAEVWGPRGLKALKAVLPEGTALWPVGGVAADNLAQWTAAGATGFGIGGQLYQPGDSAQTVGQRAMEFIESWKAACR